MGSLRIILLVAFVFIEGYNAATQCGRVEYLSQPLSSVATAAPMFQPISQFIVPAVIKPLLAPGPAPERAPAASDYNHYPNYPPMPYMPPVIYRDDDDDDDWHHLLYFLLFAMRNRGANSGYGSYPPPPPYVFYPVPSGYPDRGGCDDSYMGNNVNYIPYPVPMPSSGGIVDPTLGFGDDITIMQSPSIQALSGRDNEVTLLIRTEN